MPKKIAVLTGGGDAPGLNAVIRAIVKYGSNFGWTIFGVEECFNGFYKPNKQVWELTPKSCQGLLTKGGTILGTVNKGFIFEEDENGVLPAPLIAQTVADMGLDGLVVIGGDGTQTIAYRLMTEYGLKVIGVPKTIDNDLSHTDYTFGFWSAVDMCTDALDRLHTTGDSHDRVMILEVMGRTAGWISLYAGISGGADCIIIPEIPYDPSTIVNKILERRGRGRHFSTIIIAEGAKPLSEYTGPEPVSTSKRFTPGKASDILAAKIMEHLDVECRTTVLGHLQRGGSPSAFDRLLATRFGIKAVDMVLADQWGELAVLQNGKMNSIHLSQVAGAPREIPHTEELIATAKKVGICLGDK